ncbi:MAG: murein biosynthesis integral membrane protein MurJ [Candidatus Kerfeldbacteria bacterium]
MPERFIGKLQKTIAGGAIIIGSASVLSRILGLLRDRLLSATIGPGELLDSYFTAFKIPDFIFNIFVLGLLSAAFVPVFIEFKKNKGEQEAMKIANSVLNLALLSLIGFAVLCFIFAPWIVSLIAFGDTAAQQETTVLFTRLMLASLVLLGVSNVLSGVLHAYKKFFVYAMAPILYNVGIIIGILVLKPMIGDIGLALGVVLGAALHFLILLPGAMRAGFRYAPIMQLRNAGVRQIIKLMPPRAFALGLTQLNIIIIFAIASTMDEGTRSIWQFADNLQHFPINIFGVSLALAAFPVFSEAFAKKDINAFKKLFSESFRRILFFIIPISIATLLLRAQIVRLVYGSGEFDWTDTILTAQTLGMFALSMFAQAAIPLLARSFFAKQDTKTPVVISSIAMALNIVLALSLAGSMGVTGLALAFSIAALFQMVALLATLRVRHGDLDDELLISSTWKIIIASLGMGLVIQGAKYIVAPMVDMQTFKGILIQSLAAILAGGVTYILIAAQFRFKEAYTIRDKAISMWRQITG